MMGMISQRLRASAKGQQCTLQFPRICNHDPETTVLCHLPSPVKGMGNKGDDFYAVFACSACHAAMDQHDVDPREIDCYMLHALQKTIRHWIINGDLVLAGVKEEKAKPKSSKQLPPRRPLFRGNK